MTIRDPTNTGDDVAKVTWRETPANGVAPCRAPTGVRLPRSRVSGLAASEAEVVGALKLHVPELVGLSVAGEREHLWLMLGEGAGRADPVAG